MLADWTWPSFFFVSTTRCASMAGIAYSMNNFIRLIAICSCRKGSRLTRSLFAACLGLCLCSGNSIASDPSARICQLDCLHLFMLILIPKYLALQTYPVALKHLSYVVYTANALGGRIQGPSLSRADPHHIQLGINHFWLSPSISSKAFHFKTPIKIPPFDRSSSLPLSYSLIPDLSIYSQLNHVKEFEVSTL